MPSSRRRVNLIATRVRHAIENCAPPGTSPSKQISERQKFFRSSGTDISFPRGGSSFTTYGKTLSPHDAEQQRVNTLLLTNAHLPSVRKHLLGFAAMEATLTAWINQLYDTSVELFYAHGLRQGPDTLRSTGFDVHQDTEDYDFIEYTIVVKLTADERGEAPSAMRVVGAPHHFYYGGSAGDSGAFRARLHHASVGPESEREHLKVAFFFRKSDKGERLAARMAAAGRRQAVGEEELAALIEAQDQAEAAEQVHARGHDPQGGDDESL